MASPHPDGESLALVAMESSVPPEVTAHIASCPDCTKDLSLLRSLLAAEGSDSTGEATQADDPEENARELSDAMAEGTDAREAVAQPRPPTAGASTPDDHAPGKAGSSGINTTALTVALVIFVAVILLAVFALR